MNNSLSKLNNEALLYQKLAQGPSWWNRLKKEKEFYIEVRKDNTINVYFEGGNVARIHYCSKHKKMQVFTHHKYLEEPAPSEHQPYIECCDRIEKELDNLVQNIKLNYSQKKKIQSPENWSEKYIQGKIITHSTDIHLDSEFAFVEDSTNNRIDIIRCIKGQLTFVELKRIQDGRMLHQDDTLPEVVSQMRRYEQFIGKYSTDLLPYYQKLYDIKKDLGLPIPLSRPTSINRTPELIIFDGWERATLKRDIHRNRLEEILEKEDINYHILKP